MKQPKQNKSVELPDNGIDRRGFFAGAAGLAVTAMGIGEASAGGQLVIRTAVAIVPVLVIAKEGVVADREK